MRWAFAAFTAVAILGAGFVVSGGGPPAITFTDDVPSDVRELATATWDEFTDFFSDRSGCFPGVTVDVAWHDYPERAEYFAATDSVVVRIPATAPRLRTSLLHEFAHHLEANCEELSGLTTDLRAAQGLPADADWYDAELWALTPSEHFAETVAETIAGFRTNNLDLILVSDSARQVVSEWAGSTNWTPRDGWQLPAAP
ncbi:MAG: hypothetical protein HKN93_10770 [Acidimicrobiia bacterium]|nr:hypothetical protein [Acidimicrobiia bacterium]